MLGVGEDEDARERRNEQGPRRAGESRRFTRGPAFRACGNLHVAFRATNLTTWRSVKDAYGIESYICSMLVREAIQ